MNSFSNTSENLPNKVYATYALACKEIANSSPIDYFFAQDLVDAFTVTNSERVELFHILMALSQSLREGHTCLPIGIIANTQFGYACDDFGLILNHGYTFSDSARLNALLSSIEISPEHSHPIVFNENRLYLRRYYQFEKDLFSNIETKSLTESSYSDNQELALFSQCINTLFPEDGNNQTNSQANTDTNKDSILEIDWQKVAVANALNKNFSVIAGGPGTGKTYTVTKLLAALVYVHQHSFSVTNKSTKKKSLNMALVAPTGKAAQRLSESIINAIAGFRGVIDDGILNEISSDTHTIHRLLGVIPNSPNFRFNENNKLNIDVLLIDEVSMVDLALMNRVFRALPENCKVILLGDADQLPSVAAGSVLNDLAQRPFLGYSKENAKYLNTLTDLDIPVLNQKAVIKEADTVNVKDSVTFLTKSRRFAGEGGIGQLAKAVIEGNYKDSWGLLTQSLPSSEIIAQGDNNQVNLLQEDLAQWLTPLVEKYYLPLFSCNNVNDAFRLFATFRVLCATRVGEQGVDFINELITTMLINKGAIRSDQTLYHGRPIMISENNYHQGLYNGDIGFLWKNETGHLMAVFESTEKNLKWIITSKLPKFETVYAMTIHKTQGSEFTDVVMILPNQKDNRLLSRELLYTGITRAKKQINIAVNYNVWKQSVLSKVKRYSSFQHNS